MTKESSNEKAKKEDKASSSRQPDPETLHTTDPQEHMKGPISSLVHKAEKGMENNDKEPKKEEKED